MSSKSKINNVHLKVHYYPCNDIRRLVCSRKVFSSLNHFSEMIQKNDPREESPKELKLHYQDEEKDWILIHSDEDLEYAWKIYRSESLDSNFLRIRVRSMPSKPDTVCSSPDASSPIKRGQGRFYHQRLGRVDKFLATGKLERAKAILNRMLRWNSDRSIIRFKLAAVESLQNHPREALEEIERAIEEGFQDIDSIYTDENLKNVRELEEFEERISKQLLRMKKKKETQLKDQEDEEDEIEEGKDELLMKKENRFLVKKRSPSNSSSSSSEEDLFEKEGKTKETLQESETDEDRSVSPPPKKNRLIRQYSREIQLLREMGYKQDKKNARILKRNNGVLAQALKEIIQ
eukprot:gb/GECH01001294.1/.p1 GENE.gb/GECH01001294.1/~~gb/GECH01001294.1/.p1  ORF type:complete len:347 (+),score=130.18 gb/GECH01001294.1/:1-1041(+)